MSKPVKRRKGKLQATTKTELKKRAQESVRKQPAARRTRVNCEEGFTRAVLGIHRTKRPKYAVGDTWVNEHHQLLRIIAVLKRFDILDSRYSEYSGNILVIEVTEANVQLQYISQRGFTPDQWGWERLDSKIVPVTNPVSRRQLQ